MRALVAIALVGCAAEAPTSAVDSPIDDRIARAHHESIQVRRAISADVVRLVRARHHFMTIFVTTTSPFDAELAATVRYQCEDSRSADSPADDLDTLTYPVMAFDLRSIWCDYAWYGNNHRLKYNRAHKAWRLDS